VTNYNRYFEDRAFCLLVKCAPRDGNAELEQTARDACAAALWHARKLGTDAAIRLCRKFYFVGMPLNANDTWERQSKRHAQFLARYKREHEKR
jgi:hypothetical protein